MTAEELLDVEDRVRALTRRPSARSRQRPLGTYAGAPGFLITRLRDHDAAREAFGDFAKTSGKAFGFSLGVLARVWCYTLARHAASRHVHQQRRRSAHSVRFERRANLRNRRAGSHGNLGGAQDRNQSRISQLREQLPIDEQTLLILRVNRQLRWKKSRRSCSSTASWKPRS